MRAPAPKNPDFGATLACGDGVDSEGRRLDRREFKETIKALQWLANRATLVTIVSVTDFVARPGICFTYWATASRLGASRSDP